MRVAEISKGSVAEGVAGYVCLGAECFRSGAGYAIISAVSSTFGARSLHDGPLLAADIKYKAFPPEMGEL